MGRVEIKGAQVRHQPVAPFPNKYVIYVAWAEVICLICMNGPRATGPRASAYILGKSQLSMLHMLCNTMATALLTQSHKELSHLSVGLVIQASTSI